MTDLEKFIKIFNGLEERFGYHIASYTNNEAKRSGLSKTSHYPHTKEMWQAHLEGKKFKVTIKTEQGSRTIQADSLGICPINKDSQCQWGAIDLDNYKPNIKELVQEIFPDGAEYCIESAGRVSTIELGFSLVNRNKGKLLL